MRLILSLVVLIVLPYASWASAEDWPMRGRSRDHNPVSLEQGAPLDWQIHSDEHKPRNIRWSVSTSGYAFGGPVVANGLVWSGGSNSNPLVPSVNGDRGVLACFRESDGKFLYQYTASRLAKYTNDWPMNGLSGSPLIERGRLWFITNRREVVCLDIAALQRGDGPAKELWKYDLVAEHGVVPASPQIHWHDTVGSVAIHNDLLFVPTGNGVAVDHPGATKIKAPQSPAIVCLRKDDGMLVWKDHSAGDTGYGGHHASPLVVETSGEVQVIHPQADGWVRSYAAECGKLVWQFDTNYKEGKWDWTSHERSKSVVTATPVFADGRVYFAQGRDHEFRKKFGRMFCIDPTRRGDISPELDDGQGRGKPNPNSGLIWEFTNQTGDPSARLEETNASAAVAAGLVIIPDASGKVHCLDAITGHRYWAHDLSAQVFGDPLIVDRKIYVGDDNGNVTVFKLSKTLELLATREMNQQIISPPVFANKTLYIQTMSTLHAIQER